MSNDRSVPPSPQPHPGSSGPLPEVRLHPRRHFALLLRSLLLQASWSFERRQAVGFAAILAGEGRRLTRERPGAAADFLVRHLALFNTNPAMAGYLAGVTLRLEECAAAAASADEAARYLAELERFKRAGASAFAAWGDRLFWATLRPSLTAMGALLVLVAGAWGAIAWLIVYNAAHLHYRFWGLSNGYRFGPAVAGQVAGSVVKLLPDRVRRFGLFAVGAMIPLLFVQCVGVFGGSAVLAPLVFPAVGLLMFWILRRRLGLGWEWGFIPILVGFGWAMTHSGR